MERHNFCGIYFCDWSSDNVFGNFFGALGTNAQKLIKHQLILKKLNSVKVIFKANCGNITKSQT